MRKTKRTFNLILTLALLATAQGAWAQNQPVGDIVYCHVYPYAEGLISLMGWAYDPDAPSTSISMRFEVYTDQDCKNLFKSINWIANAFDVKVPELEGLAGNHGFHNDITEMSTGTTYWVKVIAIDASGDGEAQIGSTKEITVIPCVEYGLKVGDLEITSLNRDDLYQDRIRGYRTPFANREPTVSYDPDTHTLTLNEPDEENYNYSIYDCEKACIVSGIEDLTIAGRWHMQPSMASLFADKWVIYSYTDCSLTFAGDFTFLAEGNNNGLGSCTIHCPGNVTIKSGSRMTVSNENGSTLWCNGTLTIENGVDYLEMQCKINILHADALSLGDQLAIVEPVGGKLVGFNICNADGQPTNHTVIEDKNYALPASFTVNNVTATAATVSWSNPVTTYPYTGYAYCFKKKEDANWSDEVITTENSVTLSGLRNSEDYEFRLRVLYASVRKSSASTSFTTVMALPYKMGFEEGLDRWKKVNGEPIEQTSSSSSCSDINTQAAHEGTYGFLFDGDCLNDINAYLISPVIPAIPFPFAVSFFYKNESSALPQTFNVGYSSTTDDLSQFTWGEAISISNEQWTKYEGTIPVGTKYMAIKYVGSGGGKFYLDDIVFTATLTLADGDDNSTAVGEVDGQILAVQLQGRTLYTDGDWNTLCLPFNLGNATATDSHHFDGTLLEGATVMELNETTSNLTGGTLTLSFTEATSIKAGKPYIVKWQDGINVTLSSTADWNAFAESVNGGNSYAGKNVLLGADISDVSTMAGTSEHPFSGTFEGAGHTMNVSISDGSSEGAAPFHYINGATIRNVKTTGTVSGGDHSAGLVGVAQGGTNNILDCHVEATVNTSGSYVGGILGNGTTSTTTISNCLFSGSVSASNIGILYGWGEDGGTHKVENCVARGTYGNGIIDLQPGSGNIDLLLGSGNCNVTNCWKNKEIGTQGDYSTYIYMGGIHPLITGYLGSQWTYENSNFVLCPTVNVVDENLVSPVFQGVTIDATAPTAVTSEDGKVTFVGQYDLFEINAGNLNEIILLGSGSQLGYASEPRTLHPFRAHFEVPVGNGGNSVKAYQISFGEGDETGIISIDNGQLTMDNEDGAWYSLDGRKLPGKPAQKGIYIHDGKKVVLP